MQKRVTLREIAEATGYSVITVSKALRNHTDIALTTRDYADYLKYVDGEVAPYTVDELKSVMPYYNPDATYADLQAMVDAWSIEDVATRHAEFFN